MWLDLEKRERLFHLVCDAISNAEFNTPDVGEYEEKYTARVLYPWLKSLVSSLNTSGLYVRGDGGPSAEPLYWNKIFLYPDLTVTAFGEKYLCFEIKFLRDEDPGGSLTKAVGQTFMYHEAGFHSSIGLIFDLRNKSIFFQQVIKREKTTLNDTVVFYYFSC